MRRDLTGQRFGRLVAIAPIPGNKRMKWRCACDCGAEVVVVGYSLYGGDSKSCGCLSREVSAQLCKDRTVHGLHGTRLYSIWRSILARCTRPSANRWSRYGGRGIFICDEWLSVHSFIAWAVENGYADNLSIDRINNDGPYSPENCRWADKFQQARHRTSSVFLTHDGVTLTMAEWAERTGIGESTLRYRTAHGFSGEALFAPPKHRRALDVMMRHE